MMKPVSIVTGGAGFLGSHLCDRLLKEGHAVVRIDDLLTGDTANECALRTAARSPRSSRRHCAAKT